MKKTIILIAICVVVLVGLLVARPKSTMGQITVIRGEKTYAITQQDVKGLKSITVNGKKTKDLTAYKLSDILSKKQLSLKSIKQITFLSQDGMDMKIGKEDIEQAYVAFQTQDQHILLRVIFPHDQFEQRWLKYVTRIIIE